MLSKVGHHVYLLILVNFHACGSGSAFAIRIRIQDIQTNANSDPQHSYLFLLAAMLANVIICAGTW